MGVGKDEGAGTGAELGAGVGVAVGVVDGGCESVGGLVSPVGARLSDGVGVGCGGGLWALCQSTILLR